MIEAACRLSCMDAFLLQLGSGDGLEAEFFVGVDGVGMLANEVVGKPLLV